MLFSEIHGEGAVDKNYETSIDHMLTLAKLSHPNKHAASVNVAEEMDVQEFLAYRSAVSGEKTLAVMMDADGCFYGFRYFVLLKLVQHLHGNEIRQALEDREAVQHASELIERIRRLSVTVSWKSGARKTRIFWSVRKLYLMRKFHFCAHGCIYLSATNQ